MAAEGDHGAAEIEVKQALAGGAEDVQQLPDRPFLAEQHSDLRQNIKLKKWYAISLLIGLGVQILIVDIVLFLYAWKGVHWKVDVNVIYVWLSATVVEVIGVVYVVTRHLFPTQSEYERSSR